MAMNIRIYNSDDVAILKPEGENPERQYRIYGDLETIKEFDAQFSLLLKQSQKKVIVDLANISRLCSTEINLIAKYYREFDQIGGKLKIAHPSEMFKQQMQITKLDSLIEIYDTLNQALDSFKE